MGEFRPGEISVQPAQSGASSTLLRLFGRNASASATLDLAGKFSHGLPRNNAACAAPK